jgi:hypothetical protein
MEVAENDSQDLSNNCKILGLEWGKNATFLMMTFAYRFTYYSFYGLHIRIVDAFLKRASSNLNNIFTHTYILMICQIF